MVLKKSVEILWKEQGCSRHVDELLPGSDDWRNVRLEGGQLVDWSRWCGQEGAWQGSLSDRMGLAGEKP